jgi:hypothetical protein
MKYSTHPVNPPNLCLDCGTQVRRPKHFCDDQCREQFGRGTIIDQRGAEHVAAQRKQLGITAEALDWRRKRGIQQPF